MKTQFLVSLLAGVLILASCEEGANDSMKSVPGNAAMRIVLVDDPAAYDAVLIDVVGLEYKHELDSIEDEDLEDEEGNSEDQEESESHWVTVEIESMVFDLLELNNGNEALLADIDIPEGELKEVRLILGANNHLVVDGDTVELKVPSGSSSGLKIKIDADIEEGKEYKLVLDFDASRSIVKAGNSGKYNLKPVIHATLLALDDEDEYGAIEGMIWPDTVSSVVYVIHDEDSVSTIPEETGYFLIELLEEGDYEIVAVPEENSGFSVTTMSGVSVMSGMVSNIDTLTLEHQ